MADIRRNAWTPSLSLLEKCVLDILRCFRAMIFEQHTASTSMIKPAILEDMTTTRSSLGCQILYGAGAQVLRVNTSSDSCGVILYNLPSDITTSALADFVDGTTESSIKAKTLAVDKESHRAVVEFGDAQTALRAVARLNGSQFQDRRISVKLDIHTTQDGQAILRSTKVKVSWFAPSRIAWATYNTTSAAVERAAELDGLDFDGRKVSTRAQYSWSHLSKSIEIKGLPTILKVKDPA